jgi:hypothetical protein
VLGVFFAGYRLQSANINDINDIANKTNVFLSRIAGYRAFLREQHDDRISNTSEPTLYKGQTFRSRLEEKWAAFFDILEWEWVYEPFDLGGWSPDFAIRAPGAQNVRKIVLV